MPKSIDGAKECFSAAEVALLKRETPYDVSGWMKEVPDGRLCENDFYEKIGAEDSIGERARKLQRLLPGNGQLSPYHDDWQRFRDFLRLPEAGRRAESQRLFGAELEGLLRGNWCKKPSGKSFQDLFKKAGGVVNKAVLDCAAWGHAEAFSQIAKTAATPQDLAQQLLKADSFQSMGGRAGIWMESYLNQNLVPAIVAQDTSAVARFFKSHPGASENVFVGKMVAQVVANSPNPPAMAIWILDVRATGAFANRYLGRYLGEVYTANRDIEGLIEVADYISSDEHSYWETQFNFIMAHGPTVSSLRYLDKILDRGNRDGRLLLTDLRSVERQRSEQFKDYVLRGISGFGDRWPKGFELGFNIARAMGHELFCLQLAQISGRQVFDFDMSNVDVCLFANLIKGQVGGGAFTLEEFRNYFSRFASDTSFRFDASDEIATKAAVEMLEWSATFLDWELGSLKRAGEDSVEVAGYARNFLKSVAQLCGPSLSPRSSCFEKLGLYWVGRLHDRVYPSIK